MPALAEVYDKGKDPDQVFEQMVKPKGFSESDWIVWWVRARTPDGRARVSRLLRPYSEAAIRTSYERDLPDSARRLAEFDKLDRAVDGEIAATDPMFGGFVRERTEAMSDSDPKKHWLPLDHQKYIDKRRAEWWKPRISAVRVTLGDPSLYSACGLDKLGVAIR